MSGLTRTFQKDTLHKPLLITSRTRHPVLPPLASLPRININPFNSSSIRFQSGSSQSVRKRETTNRRQRTPNSFKTTAIIMSDLLQSIRPYLEGPISFKAQRTTHDVSLLLLNFGAFVSFGVGFVFQSILASVYTFVGVLAVTLLIVVPPWPSFNGDEGLKWHEPKVDILK